MSEAGPVEGYYPVPVSGVGQHPARLEILQGDAVAVEQDHGRSGTLLNVVEPNAIDFDEFSRRRCGSLGSPGIHAIQDCRSPDDKGGRAGDPQDLAPA